MICSVLSAAGVVLRLTVAGIAGLAATVAAVAIAAGIVGYKVSARKATLSKISTDSSGYLNMNR
jgi:hypothetical protein